MVLRDAQPENIFSFVHEVETKKVVTQSTFYGFFQTFMEMSFTPFGFTLRLIQFIQ